MVSSSSEDEQAGQDVGMDDEADEADKSDEVEDDDQHHPRTETDLDLPPPSPSSEVLRTILGRIQDIPKAPARRHCI